MNKKIFFLLCSAFTLSRAAMEENNPKPIDPHVHTLILAVQDPTKGPSALQPLINDVSDINAWNRCGAPALHYACLTGRVVPTIQILAARADVDQPNENGHTAAMIAASEGHEFVVKALVDSKANIETRDPKKRTAFIHAVARGHTNVVNRLLETGSVDPNEEGECGCLLKSCEKLHTPLEVAKKHCRDEVAASLLNANAKPLEVAREAVLLKMRLQEDATKLMNNLLALS